MQELSVYQVFTPNDVPTHTYVNRQNLRLEENLKQSLQISKMIVSVSGPSKSGKSVLVRRVVDPDLLIEVSGSTIKSSDDLWDQALQWMGEPSSSSSTRSRAVAVSGQGKASGEAGIPWVSKGSAEIGGGAQLDLLRSTTEENRHGGMQDVIKEIANSEYLLFIDDFHYIPRDAQLEVGRQLKAIAERGVRICAASVPHRADDVVRSNPELSGRVASVRIDPWDKIDLRAIGEKGFPALNAGIDATIIDRLAAEAFGTPQLMQALCMNLCLRLDVLCKLPELCSLAVDETSLRQALEATSEWADYSSVVHGLHCGPKERGTERKQFELTDGSTGDVYRVVLVALAQDPPALSFRYDDLIDRVGAVCINEKPAGSSITQALAQMEKLSGILSPSVRIIEWNESVLDIVEPYFLFYIRSSKKLQRLGS